MNIIRVLWGERFEGSRWKKVMRSNVTPLMRTKWTIDQTVFVFGTENAKRLENFNNPRCRIVLVDVNPWGGRRRDWWDESRKAWIRPWILKWDAIRMAQELLGPIIYCDWDVHCCVRPDHLPMIRTELAGKDLSLSGFLYKRNHYKHRPIEGQRFAASGNWIYISVRSDFPSRIIERMESGEGRRWHDELAMGELFDEMYDGWIGLERWLEEYESPFMIQKPRHRPWALVKQSDGTITGDTPIPFRWRRLFWQL